MNHPITPPPELVEKWYCRTPLDRGLTLATWAAQWGADQELAACCEWLENQPQWMEDLHAARRPEPPKSLKEQALALLDKAEDPSWDINDFSIVRQALGALPE
jgi:hypothetical protein